MLPNFTQREKCRPPKNTKSIHLINSLNELICVLPVCVCLKFTLPDF
jgi:hypothetical protein